MVQAETPPPFWKTTFTDAMEDRARAASFVLGINLVVCRQLRPAGWHENNQVY